MQRDEVSIVSDHEYTVSPQRHTAIDRASGVADQAFCQRPGVVPNLTAGRRIKGIGLIGCRDVHHSVRDYRRDLQVPGIRYGEKPLWPESCYITRIDLLQGAVTIAAEASVVSRPLP